MTLPQMIGALRDELSRVERCMAALETLVEPRRGRPRQSPQPLPRRLGPRRVRPQRARAAPDRM